MQILDFGMWISDFGMHWLSMVFELGRWVWQRIGYQCFPKRINIEFIPKSEIHIPKSANAGEIKTKILKSDCLTTTQF